MAFAPSHTYYDQDATIQGSFTEKEYGNMFEFSMNDEFVSFIHSRNGKDTEYPHKVWVTTPREGIDSGYRMALVLKTVAYIVVDEDENGPVIEKWDIKEHRIYPEADTTTPGQKLLNILAA